MCAFFAHFTACFLLRILLRIITAYFYCVFLPSTFTAFSAVYFLRFTVASLLHIIFCAVLSFLYLIRISGIVPVAHPDVSLPGIAGGFSGNCRGLIPGIARDLSRELPGGLFPELPGTYPGNCRGFSGNCRGLIPGIAGGLFPELPGLIPGTAGAYSRNPAFSESCLRIHPIFLSTVIAS